MPQHVSALAPPPGITPNFEHPEDAIFTLNLVVNYLAIALATIAVALRIYVRLKIQNAFSKEDVFCCLGWVATMALFCAGALLGKYGGGHHEWEVESTRVEKFIQVQYAGVIAYGPATFLIKVTLLLVYVRVFSPFRKTIIFIYVFMAMLVAYYIPMQIIKMRLCYPIWKVWRDSEDGTCLDIKKIFVADTVISSITDLAILIIPIPLTWSLQMAAQKRIRYVALLGAGGLATAASIARLVLLVKLGDSPDRTFTGTLFYLLSTAEMGFGLLCACVPAINVFYLNLVRYITTTSASGSPTADIELGIGEYPNKAPIRAMTNQILRVDEISLIQAGKDDMDTKSDGRSVTDPTKYWEPPKAKYGVVRTVITAVDD
ncbi:hypothetical protein PVAG01_10132 [Phlyctema vagabunda]|uniref:Rhodopsin domain-containing protein n=1 Tax=Phlyctema vagabunda TaxID=108571 RepID=A0ABR4P5P4_9HELO